MPATNIDAITARALGQTGFRFDFGGTIVYIDPYLSNSVQEQESSDLGRLIPIPLDADKIVDADWILITHHHRDHCDLDSLLPIASASPNARFLAPPKAAAMLRDGGIAASRIEIPDNGKAIQLSTQLGVETVPSAHPDIESDDQGRWEFLGYVFSYCGLTLYHAGDTAVNDEVISTLQTKGHTDFAFIPVNERNFYREKRGIIGNMSIREAFHFAEDIGARTVIPTHWDMFAANQVYHEEIELLYQKLSPQFRLQLLTPQTSNNILSADDSASQTAAEATAHQPAA